MATERLYIVQGRGNDAVGLVGRLASRIAQAGGNVVDLRQDVLHGLFTVCLVVDLSGSELRIDDFCTLVRQLGEDTGLDLAVDKYVPVPRRADKRNALLIFLGEDKPGIIATLAAALGKHDANIELCQMVAREGIFLMELLTDVSHCTVPVPNLIQAIERAAGTLGIQTAGQLEDVFNKRKRAILFEFAWSMIDTPQRSAHLEHTGLSEGAVTDTYSRGQPLASLRTAAHLLGGLPAEVVNRMVASVLPTSDTMELLQTLRVMGYRIALASTAFSPFIEALAHKLGIDHGFGVRLAIDDDSRTVVGEVSEEDYLAARATVVAPRIALREGITEQDVTVVSDADVPGPRGIHLRLDLESLVGMYNARVITRSHLLGLIGSLGVARLNV